MNNLNISNANKFIDWMCKNPKSNFDDSQKEFFKNSFKEFLKESIFVVTASAIVPERDSYPSLTDEQWDKEVLNQVVSQVKEQFGAQLGKIVQPEFDQSKNEVKCQLNIWR